MRETPFETFAEQVKPCPDCKGLAHPHFDEKGERYETCYKCRSTGLNVDDPLFEAVWTDEPEPGPNGHVFNHKANCVPPASSWGKRVQQCRAFDGLFPLEGYTNCHGTGYVLRSRADALWRLPKAIREAGYTFVLQGPGSLGTERENDWLGARFFADIHPLSDPDLGFGDVGDTVEDALCAALSKAMEGAKP